MDKMFISGMSVKIFISGMSVKIFIMWSCYLLVGWHSTYDEETMCYLVT